MATFLQKLVDADRWEAEDLVGRVGMVLHAAFLFAGLLPYGAHPPSGHLLRQPGETTGSACLRRWYTAPQLAHRKDADAAVLMLFAQGSDLALLMYLTTTDDATGSVYRERLDTATVAPLLIRPSLDDVEPWVSQIARSLADRVCSGLLVDLCRKNGLPAASCFTLLPDDATVEILRRLADDGGDLASVECTCRHLRRLVAERGGELWKRAYLAVTYWRLRRHFRAEADGELREIAKNHQAMAGGSRQPHRRWARRRVLPVAAVTPEEERDLRGSGYIYWPAPMTARLRWLRMFLYDEGTKSEGVVTWKEKYVKVMQPVGSFCSTPLVSPVSFPCCTGSTDFSFAPPRFRYTEEPTTMAARCKKTRDPHHNVATNGSNKTPHGAGAIHSPSSRYRWKHR